MIVIISVYPERVEANRSWWDSWDWEVFTPAGVNVRADHAELAAHAAAEGWDHSVKVLQDDVEPHRFDCTVGDITVYSGRRTQRHVCPRAFSCSPQGWQALARTWRVPTKLCTSWNPDVVYDTATHHRGVHNGGRR